MVSLTPVKIFDIENFLHSKGLSYQYIYIKANSYITHSTRIILYIILYCISYFNVSYFNYWRCCLLLFTYIIFVLFLPLQHSPVQIFSYEPNYIIHESFHPGPLSCSSPIIIHLCWHQMYVHCLRFCII